MDTGGDWVSTSVPYLTAGAQGHGDVWREETAATGQRGTQRIVQAGSVVPPADVAELLGTVDGERAIARRRVMYLDDRPFELTDTYYPAAIAEGTRLAEPAKIPGGAVALLAELGHIGVRVREDITARMPDEAERNVLSTEEREPVIQLIRLTLDGDDRPIQVDRMVMPAGRQRLRYELRIG